jgi:hypothetical protein
LFFHEADRSAPAAARISPAKPAAAGAISGRQPTIAVPDRFPVSSRLMETPDSSPVPNSDEQPAALAAMRRDWAEIREEVMHSNAELLDCDKPAAAVRRTTLLKNHFAKHRATLLAQGMDPAKLDMADIEELMDRYLEADAAANAAEEVMLQAFAKKAESRLAVVVMLLERLEWMESIPREELDAAPEEGRAQFLSELQNLQENREALLGELPIELRREREGRLRPE